MEKWLRNLLIFLILLVGWGSYYLSSQMKFNRIEKDDEEIYTTPKIKAKEEIKKPKPAEMLIPPPQQATEPVAPPVPTYSEEPNPINPNPIKEEVEVEMENPNKNKIAICYARLADCRGAGIMFHYPSPQNPWSEEKDNQIIECIAKVENCQNENYQIIPPTEEAQILNHYRKENQKAKQLENQGQ